MDINDLFPSKYISAHDLGERGEFTLKISQVVIEELINQRRPGGEKEMKPVLYFANAKKGLVLNKTNATTISSSLTPETDAWIGKRITLYRKREQAFGEVTDCIRVRIPVERKEQHPEGPPKRTALDAGTTVPDMRDREYDPANPDEIPF